MSDVKLERLSVRTRVLARAYVLARVFNNESNSG